MNPLASHWLRLSIWLLVASPIVAILIAWSTDSEFRIALFLTLYMWALVCVILALVALGGLALRLMNRGWRAIRR
jgi:ABC-type transport system involved in cytochrome c biogenesis permease component